MAGHSKWKNIQRTKNANDAKKSKVFSKMSRLISVAAKEGGGDIDANPRLRLAVDKAKKASMPKDNIEKAIQKGLGAGNGAAFIEVSYEGYGPGGVAFYVSALTDNKNRTVAEIRTIFNKNGGSLGEAGSTAYIFDVITGEPSFEIPVEDPSQAKTLLRIIDLLEDQDDVQEVYANFDIPDKYLN
ncbi:MAG: YebC/PmpR family DNA-binding transcriptional regulator [Patescibacteria group bacterium]